MKTNGVHGALASLALTALSLVGASGIGGCTSTEERALAASSDLMATKAEIDKGLMEIDVVLAKLDALTDKKATDLEARFDAYTEELENLDAIAAKVRGRADRIKGSGDKYFDAWEEELKGASEDEAAAHSKRLLQYKDVLDGMPFARDSYRPFAATLKEIQAALKKDLTFVNVVALEPKFKQARGQGAEAKKRVGFVGERMKFLSAQLKSH